MTYDINKFKTKLQESEKWLQKEYQGLRTGRANPALLDGVKVEAYGSLMGINELANVNTEDAKCVRISPWDMSQSKIIEKAITVANLGVSVAVDDKGLRVIFPDLTGERREEIIKTAKAKLEEAKIQVRRGREDAIKEVEALKKAGGVGEDDVKRSKNDIQKAVDEINKKLEISFEKKEKEISS